MSLTIFYNEKTPFQAIKKRSSRSRTIDIFAKFFAKPMVSVQKWLFFQIFLLGNIRQENVFYDILEGEKPFLGYKNNSFKK